MPCLLHSSAKFRYAPILMQIATLIGPILACLPNSGSNAAIPLIPLVPAGASNNGNGWHDAIMSGKNISFPIVLPLSALPVTFPDSG